MSPRDQFPAGLAELWTAAVTELDGCDGYIVVVIDPASNEADAYGPSTEMAALIEADRIRADLDRSELTDVAVGVVRLHRLAADRGM